MFALAGYYSVFDFALYFFVQVCVSFGHCDVMRFRTLGCHKLFLYVDQRMNAFLEWKFE